MKKFICLLLVITISFLLIACHSKSSKDTQLFYYLRKEIDFESESPVIGSELHRSGTDLNAILQLYLNGPESAELSSPIPVGTTLISTEIQDDTLSICLSDSFAQITGLDLSLACIALSKTAMEIADVQLVRICTENEQLNGDKWFAVSEDLVHLTEFDHPDNDNN